MNLTNLINSKEELLPIKASATQNQNAKRLLI